MYAKYTAVGLSGLFRALHQFIAFLQRAIWRIALSDSTHRILTYSKYATTPAGFSSSSYISISRFYNAQNVGFFFPRSSSKYCVFITRKTMRERLGYRVFRNVWSIRSVLIQALTCCVTEREAQGAEKGSAEHQTKVRSCGCALFFCTNATSGIMRRRRLMCESRVCPCPQGSAEWQKGETREEGGHALELRSFT